MEERSHTVEVEWRQCKKCKAFFLFPINKKEVKCGSCGSHKMAFTTLSYLAVLSLALGSLLLKQS